MDTMSSTLHACSLTCEYGIDPMGIDTHAPRLFWQVVSDRRGTRQTAYQILVASSQERLDRDVGDRWDTGKIAGDESIHIAYVGERLESSERVFWKVRIWDEADGMSAWSEVASWTMGLLDSEDWQASWMSARGAVQGVSRAWRGYRSERQREADVLKWIELCLPEAVELYSIILHPVSYRGVDAYGFPVRFRVLLADEDSFEKPVKVMDWASEDVLAPGTTPVVVNCGRTVARRVRIEVLKLWGGLGEFRLAFSQIELISRGVLVGEGTKVEVSDSDENSEWSRQALVDGLLRQAEVRPHDSMRLARDIPVGKGLVRAIVHTCGLGQYEMSVNGQPVSDDLLTPGWTFYPKTCLYDTFDLTHLLHAGTNRLELLVGNGFYNIPGGRYVKYRRSFGPLKAVAHLRLEYEDGRVETIGTDETWSVRSGPITFSCVYGGEDYDARLSGSATEPLSEWEQPIRLGVPGPQMRGYNGSAPPIREMETLRVAAMRTLRPELIVFDLGQNASLMPRVTVEGPPGSSVMLVPAELLNDEGRVYRRSCGEGIAYWKYTLAGEGRESWFPKFYYHGCRYLQAELHPAEPGGELPRIVSLEGAAVHSSSQPAGEFTCSNALFNDIRVLVRWAQRSNMMHVLTDCPHRERLGWLEQYYLNGPAIRYEFCLERLFAKGIEDMADAQLPNGLVPNVAPEYVLFPGEFRDSPEWGSAFVIAAWEQYQWYADKEPIQRHYPDMKRYVAYLQGKADDDGILRHGLGDWHDLGPEPPGVSQLTPIALTATAVFYLNVRLLSQMAEVLGYDGDRARYKNLAERIARSFNDEFYDEVTGAYATGSQTANALALCMGFVAEKNRAQVLQSLVSNVQGRGNALSSGDVGHVYLLRALAENGRSDIISAMHSQADRPGYGYQVKQGATSLTEAWDASPLSSHNHFMLGQITEWLYHDLAGIRLDGHAPAFKHAIIRPQPVETVQWVRASYRSLYGAISVEWQREDETFRLNVTLPANAGATVYLPCGGQADIYERGQSVDLAEGVCLVQRTATHCVLQIESGAYCFEAVNQ